ncbi:ATP-binding protein [Chitinispirillales bacterium ANBcel5]|uniref:Lon protease family protein n=1 Tax=Cellulosispirillum alkaliphilum TaxID=3039283 RepID=UPI002A578F2B|nr:ATP-binding protein [Chitinispirillales bacterium ANBcel5]
MTGIEKVLELRPEEAEPERGSYNLNFGTTDDLDVLDEIIGQPRALKALELGLGIRDSGYNIYMSGLSGSGKMAMVKDVLTKRVADEDIPPDWVYVNNFDHVDHPLAIALKPGKGIVFRKEMEEFVDRLKEDIPRSFRQEDFSKEKQRLSMLFEKRSMKAVEELEQLANEKDLFLQEMPDGRLMMIPKAPGENRPMNQEEFEKLNEEQKEDVTERQQKVGEKASMVMNFRQDLGRELREEVKNIEKNFALRIIEPEIKNLKEKFSEPKLLQWFDRLKEDIVDSLHRFQDKENSQRQQMAAMMGMPQGGMEDTFQEYKVNVVVDNSQTKGAPIIIEESPNYKNLFGTIHGSFDRSGRLMTDFTNIKAGSILRANGGYLVINLKEAILEPLVWKELKRTIKSGNLEYHMYDPFGVFATSSLKPQQIPLDVKIIALGSPLLYHILQIYDEDFKEIFKVKADFASDIKKDDDIGVQIARFIKKQSTIHKHVLPFDSEAVGDMVRIAARIAGDKDKITAELSNLADLVMEASYWARQDNSQTVNMNHIRKAEEEKIYRSNLIADKIKELIENQTLLISVDGAVTGQVNGLSVVQLGDYAFGRPSRVTASVGVGTAGLINIERESRLSGQNYDKAMLILEGYLRNKYAKRHSLSLSASITMEQSYGMIEGDSASVAELICLLSSLAEIEIRQDIAVTGSVNQWGHVQAIGGVTEKIEGFYDVCNTVGLTGNQGVCIPAANVRNLVLRPDVVDAIRDGKFHIYAVKNVNEAMELLGKLLAGNTDEQNTFHWRVDKRLVEMLNILKEQKALFSEREVAQYNLSPNGNKDPRPRFPGDQKKD